VTGTETTLSLSTHMAISSGFETETTIRSNATATRTVAQTHTVTRHVVYNTLKSTTKVVLRPPPEFPSAVFPFPEEPATT
jgi:hypothetical protein